jgi:hypothetical protein
MDNSEDDKYWTLQKIMFNTWSEKFETLDKKDIYLPLLEGIRLSKIYLALNTLREYNFPYKKMVKVLEDFVE